MTHKERFMAAISFRQPSDMVAMLELAFQIYGEYIGEDPVVGCDFAKLSPKEKERALRRNAEIMIEAAQKAGHDAILDFGAYWEVAPGVPALLWLPTFEDRLAQIRAVRDAAGGEFALAGVLGGMIGTIPLAGGDVYGLIERIYDDPEGVHTEAESILQGMLAMQREMRETGADAIINCTDIAFNTGTFFSPRQLEEFFFPYLARWAKACKEEGLLSILHTDGNLHGVMDQILASGINALQCVDPLAGMDIGSLKKEVDGKLALIGNVDCAVLHTGTPEEIDGLCKEVLESCKHGGGFAFGGCNAIFKGISAESYQIMVDARKKYGSY